MDATRKTHTRTLAAGRRRALMAAAGAALLAAIVLVVFLKQYRNSVDDGQTQASVLVADRLIPRGTAGDIVVTDKFFRASPIAEADIADGALRDGKGMAGRVATRDILPGEQILASDFASRADPVRGKLQGTQRAVAVQVDKSHGLLENLRAGDRVDVLGLFSDSGAGGRSLSGSSVVIARDVLVIDVPEDADKSGSGQRGQAITLRVEDRTATSIAYAADRGKIWLALRPPIGAEDSRSTLRTDLRSVLRDASRGSGASTTDSEAQR